MRRQWLTLLYASVLSLYFPATASAETQKRLPDYETRYANCWVNFQHTIDEQHFGDEGGTLGGSAFIKGREYRFSSSWQTSDIGAFSGMRPARWSLAQGLIMCVPKKSVTAVRSCTPRQRDTSGDLACDVCIGTSCKRIRASVQFTLK